MGEGAPVDHACKRPARLWGSSRAIKTLDGLRQHVHAVSRVQGRHPRVRQLSRGAVSGMCSAHCVHAWPSCLTTSTDHRLKPCCLGWRACGDSWQSLAVYSAARLWCALAVAAVAQRYLSMCVSVRICVSIAEIACGSSPAWGGVRLGGGVAQADKAAVAAVAPAPLGCMAAGGCALGCLCTPARQRRAGEAQPEGTAPPAPM